MGLQYKLLVKVENANKFINSKGIEDIESFVELLLTA